MMHTNTDEFKRDDEQHGKLRADSELSKSRADSESSKSRSDSESKLRSDSNPQAVDLDHLTMDSCLIMRGSHMDMEFKTSNECQRILDSTGRTGILARRNSAVNQTWTMQGGHANRESHTDVMGGLGYDVPKDDKSIGELFLENKSPDHQRMIRRAIAKTVMHGGVNRTGDLITPDDVTREREFEAIEKHLLAREQE